LVRPTSGELRSISPDVFPGCVPLRDVIYPSLVDPATWLI